VAWPLAALGLDAALAIQPRRQRFPPFSLT
jgi:hypothetical protein